MIGAAYAFEDLDEFREGVLGALLAAVPSERASYNEIDDDPARSWWISEPHLPVPPGLAERFATLMPQNPILGYSQRTREDARVGSRTS